MKKDKNKPATGGKYGTFLVAKTGFKKFKQAVALGVLATALIVGTFTVIKQHLPKHKPVVAAANDVTPPIPGWWIKQYFGESVCDKPICQPDADPDHDGLTNQQEYFYHTNPLNDHTVGDKLSDGELVAAGFDPSRPGHMTFDQVASPDNILGDSILFDSDVKKMVSDSQDISKVNIPLVDVSTLKTTYDTSPAAYQQYSSDLHAAINKYFPSGSLDSIANTIQNSDGADLDFVRSQSTLLSQELQAITVPIKFQTFHQYLIAFFQLLPQVVPGPASSNVNSVNQDAWYDKAQQFMAVQQRLQLEQQLLAKQFPS